MGQTLGCIASLMTSLEKTTNEVTLEVPYPISTSFPLPTVSDNNKLSFGFEREEIPRTLFQYANCFLTLYPFTNIEYEPIARALTMYRIR